MTMDLDDDFDLPKPEAAAPKKSVRFAPKGSKFQPDVKPKLEPKPQNDAVGVKREFSSVAVKLEVKDEAKMEVDNGGAVKMDFYNGEGETGSFGFDAGGVQEEEEDVVVKEIEVFNTGSLDANSQIQVLQYPLRPCWRPYELDEHCEEVRVKPRSVEIEIDFSVEARGDGSMERTTQVLSSSSQPRLPKTYGVAVYRDNKVHVNPLHTVLQIRPSFESSKPGSSTKNSHKKTGKAEDTIKTEDLKEEKSGGSSRKQKKPLVAPGDQKEEVEESWIPLSFHGATSEMSTQYILRMVAEVGAEIQYSMELSDYVNSFCPSASKRRTDTSVKSLLSKPLEKRFEILFKEGNPMHRFDALKHLAPDACDKDILGILQKIACLVQGWWVPKSTQLYGTDSGLRILARDYILLQFSKSTSITREQIPTKRGLSEPMEEVLSVLASKRESFGDYKFKQKPDTSFLKSHPEIVKEQEELWNQREKPIVDAVWPKRGVTQRPAAVKNPNVLTAKPPNVPSSSTCMSVETREALPKALLKVFQTSKVCCLKEIRQRLQDIAVSENSLPKGPSREAMAAKNAIDAPAEELKNIIDQVAIEVHGVYVLKSSTDHPKYDDFRKLVIDLFQKAGPDDELKKGVITLAAQERLQKEISTDEFSKVMKELCVFKKSGWAFKKGDGNPK